MRYGIARSLLSWLVQVPDSVEVLSLIAIDDEIVTDFSATWINYKDFEPKKIRHSFTCQFQPEIVFNLPVIGDSEAPSYASLNKDYCVCLFLHLLYAQMQE